MNDIIIKSHSFRSEREAIWRELDDLVSTAERKGVKSLNVQEIRRLPSLYRATLSSLSVARGISLDKALLRYLENLSARAYFIVYGPRKNLFETVGYFFIVGFPLAVRSAKLAIFAAALIILGGFSTGFLTTWSNSDWYYGFIPESMQAGRSPDTSTESLRDTLYSSDIRQSERSNIFAAHLFSNNAKVGMLAFALGFAFGLPVFVLLFFQGAVLGAFVALFTARGLGSDVWGWLLVHGTTELLALTLCGGAGLVMGHAVISPGRHSRLRNLARQGQTAGIIVMGAVLMFFIASILEAFARQMVTDPGARYLIAAIMFGVWAVYLLLSGRGRNGDHTSG